MKIYWFCGSGLVTAANGVNENNYKSVFAVSFQNVDVVPKCNLAALSSIQVHDACDVLLSYGS